MAGAVAERRRATHTLPEEGRRPLAPVRSSRPRRRTSVLAQPGLGRRLLVVFVCVAVLAAGRVALSFAVVQKTLQTTAVTQKQEEVRAENTALAADLARLTSTARVRRLAAEMGLQSAQDVRYLRAPEPTASRTP